MRLRRKRSPRRSKAKSTTPITSASIGGAMGSVAVPGLGPISMMVEPTKVEIYSSRFNKRKKTYEGEKITSKNNHAGVPQGARSWSKKDDSEGGVRKSLDGNNLVTLRSLNQANTTNGSSTQVFILLTISL